MFPEEDQPHCCGMVALSSCGPNPRLQVEQGIQRY
jgi:hypothetical protein